MKVSVFGSSHPKPGEKDYEEAYRLGKMLAQRGHTVMNGGYMGTMEAVSKGCAEGGGHVIGVTSYDIERWRSGKPNPWVHEIIPNEDLIGRIGGLITNCDAAIALPGGVGTLAEITLTWNMIFLESIKVPFLILVGSAWETIVTTLYQTTPEYIPTTIRKFIHICDNVDSAVEEIDTITK